MNCKNCGAPPSSEALDSGECSFCGAALGVPAGVRTTAAQFHAPKEYLTNRVPTRREIEVTRTVGRVAAICAPALFLGAMLFRSDLRQSIPWLYTAMLGAAGAALFVAVFAYDGLSSARWKRLLRAGLVGRGTVHEVDWKDEDRVRVSLEVVLDSVTPYQIVVVQKVSLAKSHHVQRGALVPLRVDPDNHNRVAIDWERLP